MTAFLIRQGCLLILLAIVCLVACTSQLGIPIPTKIPMGPAESVLRAGEDELAALKRANDTAIGKEAAKRSLASAARGVGWFAGFVGVASVLALIAGSFFGGIGRKTAFLGLAIAAAGLWVRYFILAHGYFVSEALSWVVIACLVGVAPIVGFWCLYVHFRRWNLQPLAKKVASGGSPARDVMALMPVARKTKKELDDAWETARNAAASFADRLEAANLLRRFKLPVPENAPVQPNGDKP